MAAKKRAANKKSKKKSKKKLKKKAPAVKVDLVKERGPGGEFWPVGALGAAVALLFFVTARRAPRGQAGGDGCSPDHAPEVE